MKKSQKTRKATRILTSKAFKEGFWEGFSAPFLCFDIVAIKRPHAYNSSIQKAWSDVGRTLKDVMEREGAIDGKGAEHDGGKAKVAA